MSVNKTTKQIGTKEYSTEKLFCRGNCGKSKSVSGYLRYDMKGRFKEEHYVWFCDECATKEQRS